VVGGSNVLFPYPVRELREAADEVGAKLLYDAAHLALFLPFGMFQDPLKEGAHLLTFSSHKIMSGAVGGVILTNEDDLAEKILPYSFPTFIQTRDQNKYAATAHALAEMTAFGADYARQMLSNAKALGEALSAEGFDVLCKDRGYTQTHQIFPFVSGSGLSEHDIEDRCQEANLLVTRAQRMGERSAMRLTTQEITRRGMTEGDMPQLAQWLRRLIREAEEPASIAGEVRAFLRDFQTLKFSFDAEA
jgi:glycine hydroxymethyltransferase